MPSVFISYAQADSALAGQIVRGLRTDGFEAWWDEEAPGVDWVKALESQISQIGAVVVVWTPASVDDPTVKEIARLAFSGQKLVNSQTAGAAPPFPYGSVGAADLDGWGGEEGHPGWARLAGAVRERTGGANVGSSSLAKSQPEAVGGKAAPSVEPQIGSTTGGDGLPKRPETPPAEALRPFAAAVRPPASGGLPWLIVRRVAAVFLAGWAVVMVLGLLRLMPGVPNSEAGTHWSNAFLIPWGVGAIAFLLWKEKY
jgi:hypothetical protein